MLAGLVLLGLEGLVGFGLLGVAKSVLVLFSGAGGVMSGTLGSGAGSGVGTGGAIARFKIWAIWMYAFVMLEP